MKYMLTLDGGAIRGVAQAVFLAELEKTAGFPLREIFDAFAGTSVGAILIAGLVYNEKLTAEEILLKLFTRENANRMMPSTAFDKVADVLQHDPKYNGVGKAQLIAEYVPDIPVKDTPRGNLVSITAYDCSRSQPVFFKSWDPTDKKRVVSIRVAANTSSAAPCYFPTVNVKDGLSPDHPQAQHDMNYGCDGGLFANNPTDCMYADMIKYWGKDEDICLISVGTGKRLPKPVGNMRKPRHTFLNMLRGCFHKTQEFMIPGEVTKGWGGIEWLVEGDLVNTLMQAPQDAVNYRVTAFAEALGDTYIRVDATNPKWHHADDASQENYDILRDLGLSFWDLYGAKVLTALEPRLVELRAGKRRSVHNKKA